MKSGGHEIAQSIRLECTSKEGRGEQEKLLHREWDWFLSLSGSWSNECKEKR